MRVKYTQHASVTGTVKGNSGRPKAIGADRQGCALHQLAKKLRTTGRLRHWVDAASGPAITSLLSIVAMAQALKVWQWRPGDPIDLSGDSVWLLASLKGMLRQGSYLLNRDLGAPFNQDASWFPQADQLHLFLSTKVIGLFSDNPFTVSAIYFFLGFPLAALSMYWLARQRHVGRLGSVVSGVLFSVVPGHQTMFNHLWLASYWVVPLGMWLVLRAAMGEPLFRGKLDWGDRSQRSSALKLNFTTAFCVLCIATGGIYYSAFTMLLLGVTLVVRIVATRDRRSVVPGALIVIGIAALSLGAVASVTASQDKSTLVSMTGQRGFWESELYAGKLMDLILPWIHHRVDLLQSLTVAYNSRTTPSLEQPALGVIALAGVVALVMMLLSTLTPERFKPVHPELRVLGMLTVVAISFFSIGGLGSFVALFLTSQLRTWSRLFVIIALIGLLAVGHWVTVVNRRNRILGLLAAGAIVIIGVLDQTNPAMAPNYKAMRSQVGDLTSFSKSIETKVAPGCSVFQLPVVQFPESASPFDMTDYEHFLPYLGSTSLRWSYGAFRGTSLADWQLALPQTSTRSLVDDVAAAGFCALEVNRAGFADGGTRLDDELTVLLGTPISTTHDGRLLAWDLSRARSALISRIGAAQVKTTGDLVLRPLVVYTDRGEYEVEYDGRTPYQWTGPSPEINVYNFGRTTIDGVHLTFSLAAPNSGSRRFFVHLPNGSTKTVDVEGGMPQEVKIIVDATPGPNALTITTTGEGEAIGKVLASSNADHRIVYGKLIDLQAQVADPKIHIAAVQQRVE